jgi:hypothetical protein
VVDVPDRPDVAVRLRPLKLRFRHRMPSLFQKAAPHDAPERLKETVPSLSL